MQRKLTIKIYFPIFVYILISIIVIIVLASEYKISHSITGAVLVFYILSLVIIYFHLKKVVVSPIGNILNSLTDIARYTIPQKIEVKTKDEIGLIASALNQVIFNLQGCKEVLEEKIHTLQLLNSLLNIINSDVHLKKIMQDVLAKICEALCCEEVIIFIKDEKDTLKVFASCGIITDEIPDIKFKIGEGIAGMVAKNGESIIVNNPAEDKRFIEIARHKKIKSLICVPLKIKEEVIGVISLANKFKEDIFMENDKMFLEMLSTPLAMAIENAQLYEMAITDELSSLYAYRYFKYILSYEFKRAKRYNLPLSLIFLDIDHFKNINDKFGHLAGDEVIKTISKILRDNVREIDIPCRYGGEEFAIILPQTNKDGAEQLAERIRKKIETKVISFDGSEFSVSASFGVADTSVSRNVDEFISLTDRALYKAKEGGRNKVYASE